MTTKFYLSEVIGTGTRKDPYRPVCARGKLSNWSAAIPTDGNGVPLSNTCVVKVNHVPSDAAIPKGMIEISRSEEFVAEALVREEMRKAGQNVEHPKFLAAKARIVDRVKEVGGEFEGYELKQLEEMLGVDKKDGQS